MALSLILLTGAGVLMRNLFLERQEDLGMNPQKLLTTQIWFNTNYKAAEQQARFGRELTRRLEGLSGMVNVTTAVDFPPFVGINTDFEAAGKTHLEKWKGEMGFCDLQFFRTVGLRLLRGRFLSDTDITSKRKVVVVNQTLAAKFFPGADSVGQQIIRTAGNPAALTKALEGEVLSMDKSLLPQRPTPWSRRWINLNWFLCAMSEQRMP